MSKRNRTSFSDAFHYDGEKGLLLWKTGKRKYHHAGHERPDGYVMVSFRGKLILAKHIAWFFGNGEWPMHHVRCLNGDPGDIRLDNLDLIPDTYLFPPDFPDWVFQ